MKIHEIFGYLGILINLFCSVILAIIVNQVVTVNLETKQRQANNRSKSQSLVQEDVTPDEDISIDYTDDVMHHYLLSPSF